MENNTTELNTSSLSAYIGWVQYSSVVQYNIEAAPCTIFTLQTSFKPLLQGGGRGGGTIEIDTLE